MSVNTALPSASAEGNASAQLGRTDAYGDSVIASALNRDLWAAIEGSRYVAVNPTPGTGILGHAAPTTFDETKPFLLVYNGGSKTITPVTVRLTDTVVSVGGTRIQFTQALDQGASQAAARRSSARTRTRAAATARARPSRQARCSPRRRVQTVACSATRS
jgi:hypothetical protein